ncbi:hypothetical protein C0Q70_10528 [Pomacea canaliculata]|uniref:T-lymphoma invasion and metastasis-inducing protein 2 n=1 Tax=Pomacea canaliculata TaxID=400727 RepID=A0A2T7P3E8_POMCA|nr:hypothetical protein C0Q70_10528 [Pomacea canaliculata]
MCEPEYQHSRAMACPPVFDDRDREDARSCGQDANNCRFPTQRFARKASSASSLHISPPKVNSQRPRSKAASTSSPSSPIHSRHHLADSDPETCTDCPQYPPASQPPSIRSTSLPRSASHVLRDAGDFTRPYATMTAMPKPGSEAAMFEHCRGPVLRRANSESPNSGTLPQRKSMPSVLTARDSPSKRLQDIIRPASAIAEITAQKLESPKRVVISDVITGSRTSSPVSVTQEKPNGILKKDTSLGERMFPPPLDRCVSMDADRSQQANNVCDGTTELDAADGAEGRDTSLSLSSASQASKKSHLTVDTTFTAGNSQHTSSSSSPEWPSPPEPLTPQTPSTPLGHMEFDSDTIKRLLRSFPSSPVDKEDYDLGFHDDPSLQDPSSIRRAQLARTKSLNTHDRPPARGGNSGRGRLQREQTVGSAVVCKAGELHRSRMFNKVALEEELRKRNRCAAAAAVCSYKGSYPDSGIGIPGEVCGSLPSEGSCRSRRGKLRSHEVGSLSVEGSSRDSEDQSDLIIKRLGDGPELKQYLAPDLSDEDDEHGSSGSLDTMMETDSQLSYGRQAGAIRKAGWLVVKNWLIHKKKKLELAPRRTWKRYWVCLKGTTLLFFDSGEESALSQNTIPKHILVIEGGIAQAVPEHPKRENIFSLSTACGDAYLFQAQSQIDLENWIRAIHSACASSFARQHGKDNTLKLLSTELQKLETNIDTDVKMRKMAELQMTVVTDPRSRIAIVKQIAQWEENLEKLYIDQYRFRCYIASLQGTELPNPKVLLASACKATKTTLGRLGIFTVTSFHALVSARKPLVLPNIYGKGSNKGSMLSPRAEQPPRPRSRTPTGTMGTSVSSEALFKSNTIRGHDSLENLLERSTTENTLTQESLSRVTLPNNQCYNFQTMLIGVDKGTSVRDLLEATCSKRQLNPRDHYVRIKPMGSTDDKFVIPDRHDLVKKLRYDAIEVCQKCMFQMELTKPTKDGMFGFAVEAELAEDFDRDDELQVYVCEITPGGVAEKAGLIVGDEILVINGKIVSELDMVYIETLLHESRTLFLTVRSMRTQPPRTDFVTHHTDSYISNMVCPPPPVQPRISEKSIGNLIVPAPTEKDGDSKIQPAVGDVPSADPVQIDTLLKAADQVTAICRTDRQGSTADDVAPSTRSLSDAQRMRKVIMELVETERAYVKPLKEETFLTSEKVAELFGNITEIVQFQQQFLHSLEQAIELEPDFFVTDDIKLFKRVLFSIGGSFLYYANHFKVYSSFCASHSRAQKILNPESNEALREFLLARNPKQQHSATLESYMIKPIQRILKYPLLLQQLCALTHLETDEHHHLTEALKGMEAVAEHINEMQKIYEEYGSVFNDLMRTYREVHPSKTPIELSVGELQMYGTVDWCNMVDYLGKVKKTTDFENTVFVFKMGVVFLCCERQKRRKSKSTSSRTSMIENPELLERFRTLVPTAEVQVCGGKVADMDRHYWWDLIHSRGEAEGRPERVYQFCNSTPEAKSDFMKVIRQTIRESVRKLPIPPYRPGDPVSPSRVAGVMYGHQHSSTPQLLTLQKRRVVKCPDGERHSMDIEERVGRDYDNLFRTRSKTVGDLNQASLEESGAPPFASAAAAAALDVGAGSGRRESPGSSMSNLSSSSHSGSAKLQYASTNPIHYSSGSVSSGSGGGGGVGGGGGGSPVWKPRSEVAQRVGVTPLDDQSRESTCSKDSADSEPSSTRSSLAGHELQRQTKTVVFTNFQSFPVIKDTEC